MKYKNLNFDSPLPEIQVFMELLNNIKPKFLYNLHNSSFGAVYFYISREIGNLYNDLVKFVTGENLLMHLGEPEISSIKKLPDGLFKPVGIQKIYDSLEADGIENPQQVIKIGTRSFDSFKNIADEESFSFICELPYFYDINIADTSITNLNRKHLPLQSLKYIKNIYKHSKKIFRYLRKYCIKNTRIFTVLEDYLWRRGSSLNLQIHEAKTSSYYDGTATVAQAFDLNVSKRWYDLLYNSMITRLCNEAISNHPEN